MDIEKLVKDAYKNEIRIRVARIYISTAGCIDGEKKNVLLKILGGKDENNTDI